MKPVSECREIQGKTKLAKAQDTASFVCNSEVACTPGSNMLTRLGGAFCLCNELLPVT